ncbi:MAG TPA: hypothetical protein VLC46_19415 [Thermoanaerobaculia bacterium]|jgi:hypothetical protein|nr:hypothetical protein [Thermoanaerobaculia bacterium]
MKPEPKLKPIDAEGILRKLSEMRKSIPFLKHDAPPPTQDEGVMGGLDAAGMNPDELEEFNYLAVADGLESLANELSEAIEEKKALALAKALEVYYAAEELAKDPAHTDLIPHVEAMRVAYEQSYGKPIPPKK